MNWRVTCLLAACLPMWVLAAGADPDTSLERAQGKDPVTSVMWDFYHQKMLKGAPYVFDQQVILRAPPFAEDSRQVPIEIDARAFKGQVVRILAWAELNPLPQIVDFQPGDQILPWLAIRIRIEQSKIGRASCRERVS